MGALGTKLRTLEGGGISFFCPGCGYHHAYYIGEGPGPRWQFNGDAQRPTFTPSLLIRSGHHAGNHKEGDNCWCTYNKEHPSEPAPFACGVCHLFLTDGQLQFLSDCTHALAGQTVPLPEHRA